MESTRNYNHGNVVDSAFQADVDLFRLGFRILAEEKQRETAYEAYCRFLAKSSVQTNNRGEER
mgnify:CR=1 FL=1